MKKEQSALSIALTYLSYQARTRREMEGHLTKKGFSEAEIREALDRLKEYGYVDDEVYVRRMAEMTEQHPGKGKNSIPGKLIRKGIPEELIQQTLEAYDESVDEEKAMTLARKHLMNQLDQPWRKCVDQVYRKLFGRGFTNEVIRSVIRRLEEDETILAAREAETDARYQQALALALKVIRRWEEKEPLDRQLRQRVLQSLIQKGYDTETAHRAAGEALDNREDF